jgi:hypothetical protein
MGIYDNLKSTSIGIVDYFRSLGTVDITAVGTSNGSSTKVIVKNKETKQYQDVSNTPQSFNLENQKEVNSLLKQTKFELGHRKDYINTLLKMRAYDVVEMILDVFIDDGLVTGNNNKIFDGISYIGQTDQDRINHCFKIFTKKHNPDKLVYDFIDEGLLIGEYIMPIVAENGLGVTKILDNEDIANTVCIYEGTEKKFFLKKVGNATEKLEKDTAIHFVMNPRKVRVIVKDFNNKNNSEYILP